jgi:hypothetical protein
MQRQLLNPKGSRELFLQPLLSPLSYPSGQHGSLRPEGPLREPVLEIKCSQTWYLTSESAVVSLSGLLQGRKNMLQCPPGELGLHKDFGFPLTLYNP